MSERILRLRNNAEVKSYAFTSNRKSIDPNEEKNNADKKIISELRDEIKNLELHKESIQATAWNEGFEAGKKSVAVENFDKQKMLANAVQNASTEFSKELEQVQAISLLLVDDVLAKFQANKDLYRSFFVSLLEEQIRLVKTETIVTISVSPDDFGELDLSENLYNAFIERNDLNAEKVKIRPTLKRGEALFQLEIGRIEMSVDKFIEQLSSRLSNAFKSELGN